MGNRRAPRRRRGFRPAYPLCAATVRGATAMRRRPQPSAAQPPAQPWPNSLTSSPNTPTSTATAAHGKTAARITIMSSLSGLRDVDMAAVDLRQGNTKKGPRGETPSRRQCMMDRNARGGANRLMRPVLSSLIHSPSSSQLCIEDAALTPIAPNHATRGLSQPLTDAGAAHLSARVARQAIVAACRRAPSRQACVSRV